MSILVLVLNERRRGDGEGRVNGGGRRDDIEHPRSCYQGTVEGGMT